MKKTKLLFTGIFLTLTAITYTSCGGDKEEAIDQPKPPVNACDGVNAKFSTNIATLIKNKCGGCHNPSGTASKYPFDTYDQIKAMAAQIKDAAVINSRMPKGTPLSAEDKKLLGCWIDGGALNN